MPANSTSIRDVRTVGMTVRDQDAAMSFYVDTVGFEKRLDAPISPTVRWIEVAPPGATTSIALNAADDGSADASEGTVDTGVRFTVPDTEVEHRAMRERGIDVGDVLRWQGVPAMFSFDDPDHNRFYVVEEV